MKSVKVSYYFFLTVFLLLFGGFISINAQANNKCDSCAFALEVRKHYFKRLYLNYYETYSNSIDESKDPNRKKVARAFLKYLKATSENNINDHVSHFNSKILNSVDALGVEKELFKSRVSPFYKIKSYIDICEDTIKYKKSIYNQSLNVLISEINKEVGERIKACNLETSDGNQGDAKGDKAQNIGTGGGEKSLFELIEDKLHWILVGVLIILLFIRLSKRKKSRRGNKGSRLNKNLILEDKTEESNFSKKKRKENKETTSKNLQKPTAKNKTRDSRPYDDITEVREEKDFSEEDEQTYDGIKYDSNFSGNDNVSVDNKSNRHKAKEKDVIHPNQKVWEVGAVNQQNTSLDTEQDNFKDTPQNDKLTPSKSLHSSGSSYEVKTEYFPDPSSERSFLIKDAKPEIDFRSLYRITYSSNSNEGTLDFLENVDYQVVFNNLERYLYPVCEQKNAYVHNTTLNIRQLDKGTVEIQGNKWYVTKKISIEFY